MHAHPGPGNGGRFGHWNLSLGWDAPEAGRGGNPGACGSLGRRQLLGSSGLTIFFQDDISAFVFPDDGGGQGADHIAHNHGIVPLPELLWRRRVLEHEFL